MSIDYKGGKVEWNFFKYIDFSKEVSYKEGLLSEDLLTLRYENCMIDLGWYGGATGRFTIKAILPDQDGEYSKSWIHPFANIPCQNQDDMLIQLQRAIDIYPVLADAFVKEHY